MATNKIDYDVLEQASKTYSNEAAAIAENCFRGRNESHHACPKGGTWIK